MHYAILESDIGQGAGMVAVPVAHSRPQNSVDMSQPHSVAEVLQIFYEEDFGTILENYVRMEQAKIQAEGVLTGADRLKDVDVPENSVKTKPACGKYRSGCSPAEQTGRGI